MSIDRQHSYFPGCSFTSSKPVTFSPHLFPAKSACINLRSDQRLQVSGPQPTHSLSPPPLCTLDGEEHPQRYPARLSRVLSQVTLRCQFTYYRTLAVCPSRRRPLPLPLPNCTPSSVELGLALARFGPSGSHSSKIPQILEPVVALVFP